MREHSTWDRPIDTNKEKHRTQPLYREGRKTVRARTRPRVSAIMVEGSGSVFTTRIEGVGGCVRNGYQVRQEETHAQVSKPVDDEAADAGEGSMEEGLTPYKPASTQNKTKQQASIDVRKSLLSDKRQLQNRNPMKIPCDAAPQQWGGLYGQICAAKTLETIRTTAAENEVQSRRSKHRRVTHLAIKQHVGTGSALHGLLQALTHTGSHHFRAAKRTAIQILQIKGSNGGVIELTPLALR